MMVSFRGDQARLQADLRLPGPEDGRDVLLHGDRRNSNSKSTTTTTTATTTTTTNNDNNNNTNNHISNDNTNI